MDLIIRRVQISDANKLQDVAIKDGVIKKIGTALEDKGLKEIDAEGKLLIPGFVDAHQHLDKCLTLDRYEWQTRVLTGLNPTLQANDATDSLKRDFTAEDVYERAVKAIKMCSKHGTTCIRTNVDIDPEFGLIGMEGVMQAKEAMKDIMDVQVVAFPQNGIFVAPGTTELLRKGLAMGADYLGGLPEIDQERGHDHIDVLVDLAQEFDVGLDLHMDQSRVAEPFNLPYLLDRAEDAGLQGRVQAIHCYGLAFVPEEVGRRTLERMKENDISITVTPYQYVAPRLKRPYDLGVNVSYCSDNIRDTWQPFGDGDMLHLALFVGRTCLMRSKEELKTVMKMGTEYPAKALGIDEIHGIAIGKNADLVLLDAYDEAEAIIRQCEKLYVIKNGVVLHQAGAGCER